MITPEDEQEIADDRNSVYTEMVGEASAYEKKLVGLLRRVLVEFSTEFKTSPTRIELQKEIEANT